MSQKYFISKQIGSVKTLKIKQDRYNSFHLQRHQSCPQHQRKEQQECSIEEGINLTYITSSLLAMQWQSSDFKVMPRPILLLFKCFLMLSHYSIFSSRAPVGHKNIKTTFIFHWLNLGKFLEITMITFKSYWMETHRI